MKWDIFFRAVTGIVFLVGLIMIIVGAVSVYNADCPKCHRCPFEEAHDQTWRSTYPVIIGQCAVHRADVVYLTNTQIGLGCTYQALVQPNIISILNGTSAILHVLQNVLVVGNQVPQVALTNVPPNTTGIVISGEAVTHPSSPLYAGDPWTATHSWKFVAADQEHVRMELVQASGFSGIRMSEYDPATQKYVAQTNIVQTNKRQLIMGPASLDFIRQNQDKSLAVAGTVVLNQVRVDNAQPVLSVGPYAMSNTSSILEIFRIVDPDIANSTCANCRIRDTNTSWVLTGRGTCFSTATNQFPDTTAAALTIDACPSDTSVDVITGTAYATTDCTDGTQFSWQLGQCLTSGFFLRCLSAT